ncbi:MAG: hypothetical protein DMF80_20230 [Acidobacteria bacterium]|nr:MAG: hypothetical protein DMF80_20230 [Acidobacteriota bacterium]
MRMRVMSRILPFVAIALSSLVVNRPGLAQTCDPAIVTVTVTPGDALTPPVGDASVCPLPRVSPQRCYDGWGSVDLQIVYPGTYQFQATAEGYLASPVGGDATCDYQNGCLSCHGTDTIVLFGNTGNIVGSVVDLNNGPIEGFPVNINPYPPVAYTDAAGGYSFGQLFVYGDGSGRGTATYAVDPSFDATQEQIVSIASGSLGEASFFINRPEPLRGGYCSPSVPGPPSSVGGPVNIMSGNVWLDQTDASIPGVAGLLFRRSYNSKNAYQGLAGVFGRGWRHSYEATLSFPSATIVIVRNPDGTPLYYRDGDGDLTYTALYPVTERSWLVKSGSGFTRYFKEGGSETYDLTGHLLTIVDAANHTTTLERGTGGRLDAVVDPGGRRLSLAYDGSNRVSSLTSGTHTLATYGYDGSNQLSQVQYGDGSGYTFAYDGSGQLLSATDLSGRPIESHEYSGSYGVTSEIADGREKYTLSFGSFQTTVNDGLGNQTVYQWANVAGQKVITKVTGPCSSCGGGSGETREWTYDSKGRISSYKDGAGTITTYTYDADGNLQQQQSPSGTTSYTYDSQARVLTVSAPASGTTTNVYGPAPARRTSPILRRASRSTSPIPATRPRSSPTTRPGT